MYTITPLETKYRGVKFRSRLEARWAVFFNEIGLAWQYEPDAFPISKEPPSAYLPDFFLPDLNLFWEVKPEAGNTRVYSLHKVKAFFYTQQQNIVVVEGLHSLARCYFFFRVPVIDVQRVTRIVHTGRVNYADIIHEDEEFFYFYKQANLDWVYSDVYTRDGVGVYNELAKSTKRLLIPLPFSNGSAEWTTNEFDVVRAAMDVAQNYQFWK